jgi:hydrogenase maturation protease
VETVRPFVVEWAPMGVAIIGVGNILMMDEGIGVRVIEELRRRELPEGIDLFDAGTALMDLMGDLRDYDRLIIVDAVQGGSPPGTLYRFRPEDLGKGLRGSSAMSLHQISLLDGLELERLATGRTYDITIIGVEPERIEMGLQLSAALRASLTKIAEVVLGEAQGRAAPAPGAGVTKKPA